MAVADPVPAYRRGLMAVLSEAGFAPVEPDDLEAWLDQHGRRGVAITVGHDDGPRVAKLRALGPGQVIVALLSDASVDSYIDALSAGATAAAAWDDPTEVIVKVVANAFEHYCLLPLVVAQGLTLPRFPTAEPELLVTAHECTWLQHLAAGGTVAELSSEVGYSEREMFRILHDLYVRMGVQTRTEALVKAAQLGMLK